MDPISDALIRIKNSYAIGKQVVIVKYSKLVFKLIKLLQDEGYVQSAEIKERQVVVSLKYDLRKPAITDVKRISKPSLRIYKGVSELPYVLNGLGIAVISTPKGLLTDKQARKLKVGGEVLAFIW